MCCFTWTALLYAALMECVGPGDAALRRFHQQMLPTHRMSFKHLSCACRLQSRGQQPRPVEMMAATAEAGQPGGVNCCLAGC